MAGEEGDEQKGREVRGRVARCPAMVGGGSGMGGWDGMGWDGILTLLLRSPFSVVWMGGDGLRAVWVGSTKVEALEGRVHHWRVEHWRGHHRVGCDRRGHRGGRGTTSLRRAAGP